MCTGKMKKDFRPSEKSIQRYRKSPTFSNSLGCPSIFLTLVRRYETWRRFYWISPENAGKCGTYTISLDMVGSIARASVRLRRSYKRPSTRQAPTPALFHSLRPPRCHYTILIFTRAWIPHPRSSTLIHAPSRTTDRQTKRHDINIY